MCSCARAQLKQVLQRYQQAQTALQRERDKVKEALLDSRNMAEVSMQYSGEQEEKLINKATHSCATPPRRMRAVRRLPPPCIHNSLVRGSHAVAFWTLGRSSSTCKIAPWRRSTG